MADRNWASAGKIYSMHVMPVLVDMSFIVDSTNANGLGIRSLKGNVIDNVYMHTSATPATGNPNPASGVIIVQFADNYNRYLSGFSGQVSALGSSVTSTTANTSYVVTSLGTSTAAEWLAVGFPSVYLNATTGLPNVGAAFTATASMTIGGSATVAPSASSGSGISHIEVLGDVNQTISSTSSQIVGAQAILQCFSGTTLTAPTDGSVIGLTFIFNNSAVPAGSAGAGI